MTAAQTAMYFAEFGKLREVMKARGWSHTRTEQRRHELTKKALGFDKSSKAFTNGELDKVLAVIKAELEPANFDAQMRLQDMPEKRCAIRRARIETLKNHIGIEDGRASAYIDGISRKMFGVAWHDLPERGLQQIEGILRKRMRALNVVERCNEFEREAQAHAEKIVGILAPEIERQDAAKLVPVEEDKSEWF